MNKDWIDYRDYMAILTPGSNTTIANMWGNGTLSDLSNKAVSAEKEIEELHKLFDELAPDTSGMKTIAEKLRSILTEPRFEMVRK